MTDNGSLSLLWSSGSSQQLDGLVKLYGLSYEEEEEEEEKCFISLGVIVARKCRI